MELSIEDIKNKFETLPEDLKWAIMGARIDEQLVKIGQGFGLNIRQLGQLSLEVHATMLGFTHPDDFESSISKSIGLDAEKNKLLADEIYQKILKEVRDRLIEYRGGAKPENQIKEKTLPKEIFEKKEEVVLDTKPTLEPLVKTEPEKIVENKEPAIKPNIILNKLNNETKTPQVETKHEEIKQEKKVDPYREIPE